jgi:Ribonuclease G/E
MRRVFSIAVFAVAFVALGALTGLRAADEKKDEKPKYSVKEVMKKHQDVVKKVKSDTATAEEKKNLLELYTEMAKNKAPRGDAADWKKLNEALVKATQNVVDGKDGAKSEFEKASDCAKCHAAHKPKK